MQDVGKLERSLFVKYSTKCIRQDEIVPHKNNSLSLPLKGTAWPLTTLHYSSVINSFVIVDINLLVKINNGLRLNKNKI